MPKKTPIDRSVPSCDDVPMAERGWLAGKLCKLPAIAASLSNCEDADELMRDAVQLAQERLGFRRMGIWLLENDGASAVGTYGVDANGSLIDERGDRIFDNDGRISSMMEAWKEPPHYFISPKGKLRTAEGVVVGEGIRLTAPLLSNAEIVGFVGVDNLIETESVNDRAGPLLCQFAQVVSHAYVSLKMQEELERSRAAVAEAERVQSEFLAMMGHEVRTPLNAMMGYAQLLGARDVGGEIKDIANTIEESGRHMKDLIDSVLEYSHLSNGDVRRWYKPGDPISVVEATVHSFEEMYREKGLSLALCCEGKRVPVYFDAVSLRQVLSNLLQNALKFTEKGGVQVKVLSRVDSETSEFFVEVKDTGIGIDASLRQSIFEPFRQVSKERDREKGGIGMGLAIVKRLVAAMGGSISCGCAGETGTVFTINLNFNHAVERGSADAGDLPINDRAFSRLLIVEDDETNLELLRTMVKCLGYVNTDSARNGVEAKELLSEHPYDIVLMDVQMPRLDGLSLTRIVRSGELSSINREVPIVAVTAYTSEHDRDECLMVGMNDYLPKPIMLESLRRVLAHA